MWDPWAQARAAAGLRDRLQWFLLGRVVVISAFLGVVAILYLRTGQSGYLVSVNRLLLAVGLTYAFSIGSALVLRRVNALKAFTHVQVAFDILLISGVVYLTSGITSPFVFLYSLPIINSAVLLFSGGALVSAALATLAYDGLAVALWTETLPMPELLSSFQVTGTQLAVRILTANVTFFLIAYLAGVLTRRLHTMEELLREREAERDYLSVLQDTMTRTLGNALLTTDHEGRITSADQNMAALADRAATELVGADLGHVFPALRLTPSARLQFLQSSAAVDPVELEHERSDGARRLLRCTAAPLTDTYRQPIGALYVFQDVTELRALEAAAEGEPAAVTWRGELDATPEALTASDGLIGDTPAMHRVRDLIRRVAGSDATVLLTGESGTGKELAARAIHARSPRAERPFIAINCGAIPADLIESELFGHVRGAFTGAVADRAGCFRAADRGTIFLDEIGELPLPLQVKLLRVLQERVFRPVGSETSVAVDVRVIAATNRDLEREIAAGRFREDLFYRLNVIAIELPALRERREDIPVLIQHFLARLSELHGRSVARFSREAAQALVAYDYPGNVRELENIVEHAVALCDDDTATTEHLPGYLTDGRAGVSRPRAAERTGEASAPAVAASAASPAAFDGAFDLDEDLATYEKRLIERALDQAGGVKKRAAEILGINYRSLRHRLQKYGIGDASEA